MTRTSVALVVVMVGSIRVGTARADNLALSDDEADRLDKCLEQSEFVGHRDCSRFGLWGAAREGPYVFAAVGFSVRRLPRPSARANAQTTNPVSARMLEPPPEGGADSSVGYVERLSVALWRPIFVGLEAEIGFSDTAGSDPNARSVFTAGVGIVGLRIGTGPFVIGAELAGGGRVIESDLGTQLTGEPVLEARVLADLWLSPWLTIGGALGTSLLDRGDRMCGLYIGIHSYSFGR